MAAAAARVFATVLIALLGAAGAQSQTVTGVTTPASITSVALWTRLLNGDPVPAGRLYATAHYLPATGPNVSGYNVYVGPEVNVLVEPRLNREGVVPPEVTSYTLRNLSADSARFVFLFTVYRTAGGGESELLLPSYASLETGQTEGNLGAAGGNDGGVDSRVLLFAGVGIAATLLVVVIVVVICYVNLPNQRVHQAVLDAAFDVNAAVAARASKEQLPAPANDGDSPVAEAGGGGGGSGGGSSSQAPRDATARGSTSKKAAPAPLVTMLPPEYPGQATDRHTPSSAESGPPPQPRSPTTLSPSPSRAKGGKRGSTRSRPRSPASLHGSPRARSKKVTPSPVRDPAEPSGLPTRPDRSLSWGAFEEPHHGLPEMETMPTLGTVPEDGEEGTPIELWRPMPAPRSVMQGDVGGVLAPRYRDPSQALQRVNRDRFMTQPEAYGSSASLVALVKESYRKQQQLGDHREGEEEGAGAGLNFNEPNAMMEGHTSLSARAVTAAAAPRRQQSVGGIVGGSDDGDPDNNGYYGAAVGRRLSRALSFSQQSLGPSEIELQLEDELPTHLAPQSSFC